MSIPLKYVSRAVKSNLNTSNLLEFLEENTLLELLEEFEYFAFAFFCSTLCYFIYLFFKAFSSYYFQV